MGEIDRPVAAALDDRLRFETLIADLSSEFVNVDSDRLDSVIEDAMRRLVEALGLDRSTLFQFSEGEATFVYTHSWTRPGLAPLPSAPVVTADLFPWALAKILKGERICFSSLDELPSEGSDRAQFERFGTRSNVTVPLVAAGRVIGALAFGSKVERRWAPEIINRLSLVGQVFASALARKRAETALRRALEENARLRERVVQENAYLQHEMKAREGASAILGQSPAIQRVLGLVDQVAPTGATTLLLGETGTGKELIAEAIHERSPRRARAMVRVNCAAIPSALVESELFGREKGAYTGALARQAGRFEVADGSTIFLDEVGDLPGDVQVKLLRVLQEKEIERLGSSRTLKIDVRVIAATNRDLEHEIAEGRFREDLYYRLNVFPITVPPLRDRPEDIPPLVWAFIDEFSRAMRKRIESISKEHMLALQRYAWPGNVRELRNVIERAVIVSTGPRLEVGPPTVRARGGRHNVLLADVEREHIRATLDRTGWRIRGPGGAAELLGLKPSTLEGRMAKLQLRRARP